MPSKRALHWAELVDTYRVFPRLFLLSCFVWAVWVSKWLLAWYTMLPKDDRSIEASGFASVVFLSIVGFLKLVYETYSRNGRNWDGNNSVIATDTTP